MNAIQTIPSNNPAAALAGNYDPCLKAPSRPRFYSEQLLTDLDLSAIVEWAQAHFGLGRYTLGWGAVCGLSVRCDSANPGGVIVTPGYARDQSGHDIIVPCRTSIDLCQYCQPAPPPCAENGTTMSKAEPGKDASLKDAKTTEPAAKKGKAKNGGDKNVGGNQSVFGDLTAADVCVVDLYLQYDETQGDARHVPKRGCCQSRSGCDYARVSEGFALVGRAYPASPMPPLPGQGVAQAWLDAYHAWSTPAVDLVSRVRAALADPIQVRALLASKVQTTNKFCRLAEKLKATSDEDLKVAGNVAILLLLLLTDQRLPVLECRCCDVSTAAGMAQTDPGVLLARTCLLSAYDTTTGMTSCSVIAIDDVAPYRRAFGPRDCWPAPAGSVNVAGLIWQRYAPGGEVESKLRSLGLPFTANDAPAWDLDRLANLTADPIFAAGTNVTLDVVDAGLPLGKRVVAIHQT
jgi:hypothetical protein